MSETGELEQIVMRYPRDSDTHARLSRGERFTMFGHYWRGVGHVVTADGLSASWRLVPTAKIQAN